MRHVLFGFDRIVAILSRAGAALGALALLVSLGLIAYAIVLRYVFNQPPTWVDEMVGYLLVATVMAAAADALRQGEHIAVDVLTERLSARNRRIVAAFGLAASAVVGVFLVREGWSMVAFSRMVGEISTGHLEVPMAWPQMLVPAGGVLLTLAALAGLGRMALGLSPVVDEEEDAATPERDR
ncbi:MAG: TRAP transporter small permease [Pseudomonadota bacterium]